MYGSLLLSVTIRADGTVEKVGVHRSSGHALLDEAAVRIVKLAAPYAPFPPAIRKDADIIEITRTGFHQRRPGAHQLRALHGPLRRHRPPDRA